MSQFRENLRTDARTDGLTLFYRNFPAEAESPIKLPSGQLNVNLTLMFMIRCKYYKKPIICGNISLVKVLWAKSNWLHISHWIQSSHFSVSSIQKILQILQVVPSSSSTVLSSFNDSVKLLHCCDGTGYCSSWSISLLTTVSNGTFFPLPLSPQNLLVLFCCNTLPPPQKFVGPILL